MSTPSTNNNDNAARTGNTDNNNTHKTQQSPQQHQHQHQHRGHVTQASPPPSRELHALILDYLSHHCYVSTARAFARLVHGDSPGIANVSTADEPDDDDDDDDKNLGASSSHGKGLSDDEIQFISHRKEIRKYLLAGDIDSATELLNIHFPYILSDSVPPPCATRASSVPSDTNSDNTDTNTENNNANPEKNSDADPANVVEYVPPTSVQPVHLSLNLRIQAFIEASRTVPLPGPAAAPRAVFADILDVDDASSANDNVDVASTASSEILPVPAPVPKDAVGGVPTTISTTTTATAPTDASETNTTSTSTSTIPRELTDEQQIDLIHRAQKLYSGAAALENLDERARYLHELKNVGGLLAYKVPERSPLVRYLSQERREAVANQINSAILYRAGRSGTSHLELRVRQTTLVFNVLHEKSAQMPSETERPAALRGLYPPTMVANGSSNNTQPPEVVPVKGSKPVEIVPVFDFTQFMEAKS